MVERGELKVDVEGRYIVLTLPGSSYRTSYFKSVIAPGLVQSDYMMDDKDASISQGEKSDIFGSQPLQHVPRVVPRSIIDNDDLVHFALAEHR